MSLAISWSPILLTGLVILMVLDYLTGTLGAMVTGKVSSHTHTRGVAQKVLVLLLLIAVAVVEQAVAEVNGVPNLPYLRMATLGFIIAEFISIVENVARAGVLPKGLKPLLAKLIKEFE
jgi:toxin secretion/phage lysis holin